MILVEGLDLAGKTTLCSGLAEKLRLRGLKVTIAKNNLLGQNLIGKQAKQYAMGMHTTSLETGALFVASHLYDAKLFQIPQKGCAHIQDSSWLRTISYNVMRNTPIIPGLADVLFRSHPTFDVVIYLTADIKVRQERIRQREAEMPGSNTTGDFMSFTDPEFVIRHDQELLKIIRRFYPDTNVLDTSTAETEAVIKSGWQILNEKFL